jgi:hypothetical protein
MASFIVRRAVHELAGGIGKIPTHRPQAMSTMRVMCRLPLRIGGGPERLIGCGGKTFGEEGLSASTWADENAAGGPESCATT